LSYILNMESLYRSSILSMKYGIPAGVSSLCRARCHSLGYRYARRMQKQRIVSSGYGNY
jgi:hypothetical protein